MMEEIRSRQNDIIKRFIALGSDGKARQQAGEYLCAGQTLLDEAIASEAEITCVLGTGEDMPGLPYRRVTPELLKAVSPLQNSPGPVFTVRMGPLPTAEERKRVIVLENVQDPGNVGTVLRTADAFGIDLVVLCGACADPYNPKTVRASMGAIFRQRLLELPLSSLSERLNAWGLPLYGAALSERAADVRSVPLSHAAVAVGNEGSGLTGELLAMCEKELIIPMTPGSESFNAAVAASILLWEMARNDR